MADPHERPLRRRDRTAVRPAPEGVLLVCTGNICRSAFAERALQARLDVLAPGGAEVGSAGTQPNQALAVPAELVAGAEERGLTGLERHRPVALQPAMVTDAALVLTATQAHMTRVLEDSPGAVGRTFTVRELGELVRRMDGRTGGAWIPAGAGVAAFAREAARHRVLARSAGVSLDVLDPFRGPAAGYQEMVALLEPEIETIAGALARALRS